MGCRTLKKLWRENSSISEIWGRSTSGCSRLVTILFTNRCERRTYGKIMLNTLTVIVLDLVLNAVVDMLWPNRCHIKGYAESDWGYHYPVATELITLVWPRLEHSPFVFTLLVITYFRERKIGDIKNAISLWKKEVNSFQWRLEAFSLVLGWSHGW